MMLFLMFRLKGEIRRYVWAGIIFFITSLAISLELVPLGVVVVKERYVYLSSVGLYFMFAMLLLFIFQIKYRRLPVFITLALMVFFAISTYSRAQIWKDSQSLWNDVLSTYPDASAPLINRGNSRQLQGDFTNAISDYTMALASEPNAADAYMNRGLAYFKLGSMNEAFLDIDKAIVLGIRDAEIYNVRGLLRIESGAISEALTDFISAVSLDSTHLNAWVNLGLIHANMQDFASARTALDKAIEVDSSFAKAYYWRGMVFLQEKKYNEACGDMRKAVSYGWPEEQIPEFCK
jgi:tetratricopeptide (TPR) repeat protein